MSKTAIFLSGLILTLGLGLTGCTGTTGQANSAANGPANGDPNVGKVPHSSGECSEGGGEPAVAIGSPVEAYSFLFEAVKRGDTAAVKQVSSQATRELAQFMANSYKKSCADAYKNGFSETTMQEKMPETRDLRMEGDIAAMEVKNAKGAWENVPFVKEGNGWKMAFGDLFFGKIKTPGKPQSVLEQENANARGAMNAPLNPMANKNGANGNSFKAVPVPNEKVEKSLLKNRQPTNQPKQ
jgi:hypothetical protein